MQPELMKGESSVVRKCQIGRAIGLLIEVWEE